MYSDNPDMIKQLEFPQNYSNSFPGFNNGSSYVKMFVLWPQVCSHVFLYRCYITLFHLCSCVGRQTDVECLNLKMGFSSGKMKTFSSRIWKLHFFFSLKSDEEIHSNVTPLHYS